MKFLSKNLIIAILLIVVGFLLFKDFNKTPEKQLFNTIDSLELVISDLRSQKTQIQTKTDSVIVEIIKIKENYETKYIDIASQSINSDVEFFTEYLSKNN